MKTCKVEGCEKEHHAKGFCNKHYMRLYRNGYCWIKFKKELSDEDKCKLKKQREYYKENAEKLREYSKIKQREYKKRDRQIASIEVLQKLNFPMSKKTEEAFVLDGVLIDKRLKELK